MMKIHKMLGIAALCGGMAFASCEKKQEQPQQAAPTAKPTISSEQVKQKIGEAVTATKDYFFQQSEPYRKELETQLQEMDRQIEAWRPQIEQAGAAAREQMQESLAELEKQRAIVQQKLDDLKAPSKQAWEDVKSGADKAMSEMQNAFKKAAERFKKNKEK